MGFSKELLREMQEFDYSQLFNQSLEDITPILEDVKETKEVLTSTRKTTPLVNGYKHQMARLEMMQAEAHGEYISYEQAYNN